MKSGRSQNWRRQRSFSWFRGGIIVFIVFFIWLELNFLTYGNSVSNYQEINDSNAAIYSMVPAVLHKFLTPRPKNGTNGMNGTYTGDAAYRPISPNISDIKKNLAQYNLQQVVYNEDIFGPLLNDSVVIVIQVSFTIFFIVCRVSIKGILIGFDGSLLDTN